MKIRLDITKEEYDELYFVLFARKEYLEKGGSDSPKYLKEIKLCDDLMMLLSKKGLDYDIRISQE